MATHIAIYMQHKYAKKFCKSQTNTHCVVINTLLTCVINERKCLQQIHHKCTHESAFSSVLHQLTLFLLWAQQYCVLLWWIALVHTLLGLSVSLDEIEYQTQFPHLLQIDMRVLTACMHLCPMFIFSY